MSFAAVNGVELFYEVEGQGDWVVFAHGGDAPHLCWWRQVAALRSRYRCLTYDARGFGHSGGEMGDPASSAAGDLKALLDHVGIDRAFLVGHSMGGMAVSGVAQNHPDRVRGLVMGDTPFGFQTETLSRWAAQMLEEIPAGFNVFEHLFAPGYAAAEPALHYLYSAICRLTVSRPAPKDTTDYLASYVRMRDTPPVDYSNYVTPTLFLVGEQDELTLPWLIEGTAKTVAGAAFATIAGAGPSAFYERAEEYNRLITAFFEQVYQR